MSSKKENKKKKNNNTIEKEKRKKIIKTIATLLIIVGIIIAINTFDNNKYVLKNEFSMGEVGYIDELEVTLTNASYINNNTGIEVEFDITNKRDNTITIDPDKYFVFYDLNKVQIPNKFTNDKSIVKKDETIKYKLNYDVTKKELYEIYFYSGIVENNIKFTFKSTDIKSNIIDEKDDISKEETLDY